MGLNKKFLSKLLSGLSDKNIEFRDLRKLMIDLGFKERIKGDHHIFIKADVLEILVLHSFPWVYLYIVVNFTPVL